MPAVERCWRSGWTRWPGPGGGLIGVQNGVSRTASCA